MIIKNATSESNYILKIVCKDGKTGFFDLKPYLQYEAFTKLQDPNEFSKLTNGGYFIEWNCGADLSADTIEAKMTFNTTD